MNPYLYILIRNDLISLNPGKAAAQATHAGNHFTELNVIQPLLYANGTPEEREKSLDIQVQTWRKSTKDGFGTTITLSANKKEIEAIIKSIPTGCKANLTFDPTYPYIVDEETFSLIKSEIHTDTPIKINNNNYVCFRNDWACAFVFGEKEDLYPILGHLPLVK